MANIWHVVLVIISVGSLIALITSFFDNLTNLVRKTIKFVMEGSRNFDIEKEQLLALQSKLPAGQALCEAGIELQDLGRLIARNSFLHRVMYRQQINTRLSAIKVLLDSRAPQMAETEVHDSTQQINIVVVETSTSNRSCDPTGDTSSAVIDAQS